MTGTTFLRWLSLLGLALTTSVDAGQVLYPATPTVFLAEGDSAAFAAMYYPTTPDTAQSTGLGLRVHYNSQLLEPISSGLYSNKAQPFLSSESDEQDADQDPSTDRYLVAFWFDPDANWPNTGDSPLRLLTTRFKAKTNLGTATYVRTTASATAANTQFSSTPMLFCPKPELSLTVVDDFNPAQKDFSATLALNLNQAIPAACGSLLVSYQTQGSALAGIDYQALSGQIAIPAGANQAVIQVTMVEQTHYKEAYLALTLQAADNYRLGTPHSAVILIKNNPVRPFTSLPINQPAGSKPTVPMQVPSLSSWGILGLNGLLLGLAYWHRTRRLNEL